MWGMNRVERMLVFLLAAALAGCGTVRRARDAQTRLAPRGADRADAARPAPQVDLRGAPLRALVEFALTNRPSMVSAALDVKDARLALRQIAADAPIASATPWNAADVSATTGYSETSPQAKFDDLGHTRKGKATAGLSVDLLVWDFGRNAADARAQAEKVVAAELALVREGYAVFDEVSAGYFALVRNAALYEVACTNELEYLAHLAQAEDRLALGEAKEVDVTRARLDLAKARQDVVAASNDVVTAGTELMAAMGVEAGSGTAASVVGVPAGGFARRLRALPESAADVSALYALAVTNAPDMRIARARLRAASAEVDAAVADLMPKVSASVSLNWVDPLWYWNWGANAAQALFTGGRRRTAVDRAVVALEASAASVSAAEQQLSHDLSLAVAERDNAAEARRTAQTSLREARENLALVKAQYDLGDASRVDFSDAVSALARACGDSLSAHYRAQTAEARIFRLTGSDPVYPEEEWILDE